MALHPLHEKEQIRAIEIELATARDYIQDDLRNYISRIIEPYDKVGLDDSIFEFAELVGYRINNNRLDIAEDLDVKSRYGIEKNKNLEPLISMAFRGHHNEDFKPEYQFEGLFSEEMNDMIEKIRKSKGGLIGGLIGGQATIETHGDQMRNGGLIGGRKVADMINPETGVRYVVEASRKANEAQGFHVFSLEEIADIHNFREESFNHSSKYRPNSPNWNYTTSKMNEKYGENWSTGQVRCAYHYNKDKLPDEEE